MSDKDSPQEVINSFQKSQKNTPIIVGAIAILLVIVGVVFLILWLAGPEKPAEVAEATATVELPTSTVTNTMVPSTATLTFTSTVTVTATPTETVTPSGPFEYVIEDGDNCWDIADRFGVEMAVLQAINNFDGGCPIQPGQTILIPAPGQELPTETPLPPDLAYGTEIEYTIKAGDSLDLIASKFNSTVDALLEDNEELEDVNTIYVGQKIIVRVNIVTPTATTYPMTETPEVTSTP